MLRTNRECPKQYKRLFRKLLLVECVDPYFVFDGGWQRKVQNNGPIRADKRALKSYRSRNTVLELRLCIFVEAQLAGAVASSLARSAACSNISIEIDPKLHPKNMCLLKTLTLNLPLSEVSLPPLQ